jgi:hypothetical protein
MHIIASGNAFDGIFFFGPFDDADSAVEWAERNCFEWHLVYVEEPS